MKLQGAGLNRPETGTIEDLAVRGPEPDALPWLFASKKTRYKHQITGKSPLVLILCPKLILMNAKISFRPWLPEPTAILR